MPRQHIDDLLFLPLAVTCAMTLVVLLAVLL